MTKKIAVELTAEEWEALENVFETAKDTIEECIAGEQAEHDGTEFSSADITSLDHSLTMLMGLAVKFGITLITHN